MINEMGNACLKLPGMNCRSKALGRIFELFELFIARHFASTALITIKLLCQIECQMDENGGFLQFQHFHKRPLARRSRKRLAYLARWLRAEQSRLDFKSVVPVCIATSQQLPKT